MVRQEKTILRVENLTKVFSLRDKWGRKIETNKVKAVDDVSFSIYEGDIFGLIGESGSGKSTIAKCIIRLTDASSGRIFYNNTDITSLKDNELKPIRREIGVIFQDPFSSLNPRFKIKDIVAEGLKIHSLLSPKLIEKRIDELLEMVLLDASAKNRYPDEFSGGERQRIAISRALATNPKLIIADEPVSALDPSIRAQIILLLMQLKKELGLTMLLISHELNVIYYLSQTTAVIYKGKIVELAETKELFSNPFHPYTKALISSVLPVKAVNGESDLDKFLIKDRENVIRTGNCCWSGLCEKENEKCKGEIVFKEILPDHFVLCNNV